jgi:pantoate--beta-alanine ligase
VKIIQSPKEIHALSNRWKRAGQTISLVPTMGCLHEGHLSLIRMARGTCDKTIISLFVNPIQFGQSEDLDSYPNQFEQDCRLIKDEGGDALFCPSSEEMYTDTFQTSIRVKTLSQGMCGRVRPHHFGGVATVVTKLFNITVPDVAVFGEKDFQQLVIIRQLARDLSYNIEILGAPTIREDDGLAMSSRNLYLGSKGRKSARCLFEAIQASKNMVQTLGEVSVEAIIEKTENIVTRAGGKLEYAVVVNEFSLIPDDRVNENSVLALAVEIGDSIRLIDNGRLMD